MDVASREVRGGWKEAQRHPKLEMVGSLMEQECEGHGIMMKCKEEVGETERKNGRVGS